MIDENKKRGGERCVFLVDGDALHFTQNKGVLLEDKDGIAQNVGKKLDKRVAGCVRRKRADAQSSIKQLPNTEIIRCEVQITCALRVHLFYLRLQARPQVRH